MWAHSLPSLLSLWLPHPRTHSHRHPHIHPPTHLHTNLRHLHSHPLHLLTPTLLHPRTHSSAHKSLHWCYGIPGPDTDEWCRFGVLSLKCLDDLVQCSPQALAQRDFGPWLLTFPSSWALWPFISMLNQKGVGNCPHICHHCYPLPSHCSHHTGTLTWKEVLIQDFLSVQDSWTLKLWSCDYKSFLTLPLCSFTSHLGLWFIGPSSLSTLGEL